MKDGIRVIGILSVTLLVCVVVGQGVWLNKIKEIKIDEFHRLTTIVFSESVNEFINQEWIDTTYHFSCGLKSDGKTFIWGKGNQSAKITVLQDFNSMQRAVFYDHLYQNNFPYLEKINLLYSKKLEQKSIFERPLLMVWDSTGRTLMVTDSLNYSEGLVFTQPIHVGYESKHQLVAVFREPFIFRSMMWHLVWEGVFLISFVLCLIWQWKNMMTTWRSARVQTMGMAHLEHEMKKPLATMISALGGIVDRENKELTNVQEQKLKMMRVRLMKMADVTDTMLTALKTSGLKIERLPVNIRQETELMAEMFGVLRPYAKVHFQIEEGVEKPLLDSVYFNYLVINLVDNAIKYGGDEPEVNVWFGKEGKEWLMIVSDNGIGMPKRVLKRIFRQFYRVKDRRVTGKTGFGLGLAFVKKVVEAYGGEIRVESEPGKGSRFEIRIGDEETNKDK